MLRHQLRGLRAAHRDHRAILEKLQRQYASDLAARDHAQ